MLSHVLVPLDGSELAETAVDFAIKLIKPTGKITLLTVVDYPDTANSLMYPSLEGIYQDRYFDALKQVETNAVSYVTDVSNRLRSQEIDAATIVRSGGTIDLIISTADELNVDAIVMSTHGRTGISRLLLGSVTQRVLTVSTRPVFVIPGKKLSEVEPIVVEKIVVE